MCVCAVTQGERDAVHVAEEEHVTTYLELQQQLAAAKAAMRAVVNQPRYILPFLQPGRLVNIAASASGTSVWCLMLWFTYTLQLLRKRNTMVHGE